MSSQLFKNSLVFLYKPLLGVSENSIGHVFPLYFRNPLDHYFLLPAQRRYLFLTSLVPWHSVPKPFLACFCGPTLVSLRYDRWYSSSVAVESCFHHSLPIKSGARQLQGYAGRKYLPQGSSEDLLHMLFPLLSVFFFFFLFLELSLSLSLLHSS